MVGQALLETLKEILGKDWTPEIEATWTAAYQVITQTMQHETV